MYNTSFLWTLRYTYYKNNQLKKTLFSASLHITLFVIKSGTTLCTVFRPLTIKKKCVDAMVVHKLKAISLCK